MICTVASTSCVPSASVMVSCAGSTIATGPAPSVQVTGPKPVPAAGPFRSTTAGALVTVMFTSEPAPPDELVMV